MLGKPKIDETAENLKRAGRPYVLATVVRTVAATAAKAGAKAIIFEDGKIAEGWIGGGCARGAVLKAAKDAFADGEPRLISVQPEDLLSELGVSAGEVKDGVRFARNMCPSKGTMDVFVEPVLPMPTLFVLGASPVAVALADLSRRFGFYSVACAPVEDQPVFSQVDDRIEGFLLPAEIEGERFIVVATQGRGDEAALSAAASAPSAHVAFVGSRAKAASLRAKLADKGFSQGDLDRIKAPAGLDIGAVTPEEIALSIIAELVEVRRKRQDVRNPKDDSHSEDVATDLPKAEAEGLAADPKSSIARRSALQSGIARLTKAARACLPTPPNQSAGEAQAANAVFVEDVLIRIRSCCM